MRPEPEFGLASDGLFHFVPEVLRQWIAAVGFFFVGNHLAEGESVMSAGWFFDVEIDEFRIGFSGYFFCARDVSCLLVEEHDAVLRFPVGALVLYEAAEEGLSFGMPLEQSPDGL